ncbi:hypothetical protein [Nostoc sp.]|uniref:hypothetical protein n=1 Tax=Nostoc sp. TaxID=1180 RepID=UPI002FF8DACB
MTTNLASLSLADLFGKGASQDANVLIIQKAFLLTLTPLPINTAESLLVGILVTSLFTFAGIITDENNQPFTDENNQPITFDNSEAFELIKMIAWKPFQFNRNGQPYVNNQVIVSFYVPN